MEDKSSHIIFDGKILSADDPVVPAVSRGLMYGDGVFDTLRTYSGQTLFLQKHLERLHAGCETLGISLDEQLGFDQLKNDIHLLLQEDNLLDTDAIVRLQVWRDGGRGFGPDPEAQSHIAITASSCPDNFTFPRLATVSTRRIPSESLPSTAKFTNSINYILAAQEAAQKGANDALMLTMDRWVSETTIANIFWVKGNDLFTPSADCDLIPGITRDIILQLAENVIEGEFKLDHILDADAVWVSNSVREVLPVSQIDQQLFDADHELLKKLRNRFVDFRYMNLKPLDS